MAYNSHNLSVLAYANGFTLWHYTTTDSAIDVLLPGYFAKADDMLRSRDRVIVNYGQDDDIGSADVMIHNVSGTVIAKVLAQTAPTTIESLAA